ncbi:hypothetical protein EMIHUDRAFT_245750 [Emiliania huxleyi CCMP1516]|uniref:Metalloendopeptidase n=2 Tax=Emiliania huxleyi TaxID=2903 RepID=A0A0D3IW93_EMIH1|nr:hypothetical protein EMIHUDRAFT_245750 [Emiliania huxleyi CCMP1516]EOD15528.1 hypothetical protein EMIHUDRAFT_245750 [Emiliania huxleyi CCMP1516]|eukprot:XP_005767957.1 hypothetical protein EMIHUDRAFT_245750 [Emiliania huxleyi CCMP1516]
MRRLPAAPAFCTAGSMSRYCLCVLITGAVAATFDQCVTDRASGVTTCERAVHDAPGCTEIFICAVAAPKRSVCESSSCASVCVWRQDSGWWSRSGPVSEPPCSAKCPNATAAAIAVADSRGHAHSHEEGAADAAVADSHDHAHSHEDGGSRRLGITERARQWPDQLVRWHFAKQSGSRGWAPGSLFRGVVEAAIARIEESTCICFVEVDPDETDETQPTFVGSNEPRLAIYGSGSQGSTNSCSGSATVGAYTSATMTLSSGCPAFEGVVVHEFLHSLGFLHEHSRPDRDEHIEVRLQNAQVGARGNFERLDANDWYNIQGDPDSSWDWFSIMLYSSSTFARERGLPTMVVRNNNQVVSDGRGGSKAANSGDTFGSTQVLSQKDIGQINTRYSCGLQTTCPGYVAPAVCTTVLERSACAALAERERNPCRWDSDRGRCGTCADTPGWRIDGWSLGGGGGIGCESLNLGITLGGAPFDCGSDFRGGGIAASQACCACGGGCGSSASLGTGSYNVDVDGTSRAYRLDLPTDYDPDRPYKLILVWHGLGGTADETADGYFGSWKYQGLWDQSDGSAIFVAGQGLSANGFGATGWPDNNGRDIAFVRVLLAKLKGDYCIDEARIFSTGISFGGIMSNTIGCQLGDQVRAIAPIMGAGPFGDAGCTGQVAVWLTHGSADWTPGVNWEAGKGSRDYWQVANSCADTSVAIGPDACVEYDDCDALFPVVWPAAARAATPAMTPGADKADSVDVVHDVEERWIPLRTDNAFSSVRLTADKVKVGGSPPMSFPTASAASRCGRPVAIVR